MKKAKQTHKPLFCIGDIVRHRHYPFRGVVVDVDPEFDNTEEWYASIPEEVRPARDQPFYHLLAENDENGPVGHPDIEDVFTGLEEGRYQLRPEAFN